MSVKTILVAHRSLAVRDRFAAALAEAKQDYLLAGAEAALRAALANDRAPVSLALLDLGMAGERDAVSFVNEIRDAVQRPLPVIVFAGSVTSADQIGPLGSAGVAGYLNEHADAPHILPALAPHLFPDNFNRRSWTHDSELTAVVLDEAYARDLRLTLAAEHLDRLDGVAEHGLAEVMADCLDPAGMFDAYADTARRLEEWHASGGTGERPPGRLRPLPMPALTALQQRWGRLPLDLVHDPDGRPRTIRRRHRY